MSVYAKYLSQFTKNSEKEQTHLSFNKGKYNVPDNKYDEFYQKYFKVLTDPTQKDHDQLFLIEKVTNSNFAFFFDLDNKSNILTDDNVAYIIRLAQTSIRKLFKNNDSDSLCEYIVSKRDSNYHVNFYNLIVNSTVAKNLTTTIIKSSESHSDSSSDDTSSDSASDSGFNDSIDLRSIIDMSVYRTGLRLIGSKKSDKLSKRNDLDSCYKIYNLKENTFTEFSDLDFVTFMKTVVRRKKDIQLTPLKSDANSRLQVQNKTIPTKGISNDKIISELKALLETIKVTHNELSDFDLTIARVYAAPNKTGIFCYFVSINEKYCPFKQREHQRDSSPIYLEINSTGIYMKCYDEECLRRRFPDNGFRLPDNFEKDFPQMFLSMTTKYWHSEINITDEIRMCLEDSLTGSHYQIAKALFHIYKDRFRVDDIKNTEWYEFDGVKWKKSHLMNLLISEELPKYYRGIKISDTSIQSKSLQDFLVNNDKMDANMRNQMVDNIIAKLENVSFKNNVLSQVAYLFKHYDTDFYKNLDQTTYQIGFKNGVYDFKTHSFRKGTQDDYITFSTGYDYIEYDELNPNTQEIYDFLGKIITNRRVLEYTLKVLGKSLIGVPDERFYIWTGLSGANGKSTLVNFLEHTLGEYITSVDVSLLTNKRANASNASPDVVRLRGKRIFTFQEPEHDDKLRTGILKQYTGGDTIIARELFKAPISFKLQGTMIMCCNDLPTVTSIDGGTWRRIRVVEFKSRFCDNPVKENEFKIDPTIKTKIHEWRPYFMSILIHWYNKFLAEGLNEPDEVKKATAKYKVDNDKFNEFFDAILEESSESFEPNKIIYSHFSSWWSNNYPSSRIPEMKDLRRAMKIKFGNEKEAFINGYMNYGFNIKIKQTLDNTDLDGDFDNEI